MVRFQVRLTERQSQRLKALVERHGIPVSELIRRAVDQVSEASLLADDEELRARALEVIGKYADTASDVAEQHDAYFAETLANGA